MSLPPFGQRSLRRLLVAFALLAVACGPLTKPDSNSSRDTSPAQLSLRYRTGDQDTYVLRETFVGNMVDQVGHEQRKSFDVRADEVTRVSSVDPDGTATLEVELHVSIDDSSPKPLLPEGVHSYQFRVAPDGRVVGGGDAPMGGAPYAAALSDQPFVILPDHPVVPGDSWTIDFRRDDPLGTAVEAIHADNQFERYEFLGGILVARITAQLSMPVDRDVDLGGRKLHETGTVTERITSELDPASGRFLESDTNVRFELAAAGYQLNGTQILELNRTQ